MRNNKGSAYVYVLFVMVVVFSMLTGLIRMTHQSVLIAYATQENSVHISRSGVDLALYMLNNIDIGDISNFSETTLYLNVIGYTITVNIQYIVERDHYRVISRAEDVVTTAQLVLSPTGFVVHTINN